MSTSHTIETSERNPESTTTSNNEDEPGSSGGPRKAASAASTTTRQNRFSGRNYRQKQQATTGVTSETDEELEDIFNKCMSKDIPKDVPVSDEIAVPTTESNLVTANVADETTTASATSSNDSSDTASEAEDLSFRRTIDPFVIAVTSNTDDEVSWFFFIGLKMSVLNALSIIFCEQSQFRV